MHAVNVAPQMLTALEGYTPTGAGTI